MDAYDYSDVQQPMSYYEYVAVADRSSAKEKVKRKAFQAMNELEGWCSKEKAMTLIDLVFMTKPMTIVEIGVFGGKSVVPMAFALKENKKGKIYGIDPWSAVQSVEGMDGNNKEYWSKVDHAAILKGLRNKITKFDLENQVVLIQSTSEAASPINDIDILHIDGNHSDKTSYFDATKWVPLVRRGGIIIFDDVTWPTTKRAVDWMDENCIPLAGARFKGDNEWAIWVKP